MLADRVKSGTYRAPPVRRVHIPKGGSSTETRPIGIPTPEDKVLQRAVTRIAAGRVQLGIEAPREIAIRREELPLYEQAQKPMPFAPNRQTA